ncbi:MAG TPA: WD40 repeat domain-containing protein [Leptolyngbyaceae cyanobacterium]
MELELGLKLLVEGLPAIAQIFTAIQEERLAQLKHEQAKEIENLRPPMKWANSPENWQTDSKNSSHQLATYDRESIKIAAYKREPNQANAEVQKILNNWPLRLFPSQILASHSSERPRPLRIFVSPMVGTTHGSSIPGFGEIDRVIPEIELNLTQGLRAFLSKNYPLNSQERPTEFLAECWESNCFHREASIKYLFEMLKAEPTLILETEIVGDYLNVRIAYWGMGHNNYCYQTIINQLSYRELIYASAKNRAVKWRETANQLLKLGESLEEVNKLGGDNAINLQLLEKEEKWKQNGIDISLIPPQYRVNNQDLAAVTEFLVTCHCLVAAWVADAHHLVHYDVPPLLPKLLPSLTKDIAHDQVQEVIKTIISGYQDIFQTLENERPLYVSDLAVNLAHSLTVLSDKSWAYQLVNYSLKLWLKEHQISAEETNLSLETIQSPLTVEDQKYLENLKECLVALGDEKGVAQVCCLLTVVENLRGKIILKNAAPVQVEEEKKIIKVYSSLPQKSNLKRKALLETVSLTHTLTGYSGRASSIAVTLDGHSIASGSDDNTIKLWHLGTGELLHTFTSDTGRILTITISPDGQILASSNRTSDRSYINVWHLGTGKLIGTLPGHKKWIYSLAISPDRQTLISGSHRIKIWHLGTGELISTLTGHKKWIYSLAISPDGQTLVSSSGDKTIKIWHLPTGELLHTLTGHSDWVRTVAISPDGQMIASGSDDNTIKVWDLHTGKLLRTFIGHSDWVLTVAISPDGQTLISGSKDNTIKLWHLDSGTMLRTLTGHQKWVYSLAVSPDGQTIASGSEDKTIKIWRAI